MIRGDFVNCTEEELNSIVKKDDNVTERIKKYGKNKESWETWLNANLEQFNLANKKDMEINYSPLRHSLSLRSQAIYEGFRIKSLYPIYHQGWEMDEWGATGTKDGKYYVLETNHGTLRAREIELSNIEKVIITVIKFLGME